MPGYAGVRTAVTLVARRTVPRRALELRADHLALRRKGARGPVLEIPCALTPFMQRWFDFARCLQLLLQHGR